MKTSIVFLLLLFCALCARADTMVSPDSGLVVIEGKTYAGQEVKFCVVDDLQLVVETPTGSIILWTLPDPEVPMSPASAAAVKRQVIYDALVAAVSNSSSWEEEKAAVQAVVSAHPELERVIPYDTSHAYEIFWANDPLGGIIWTPVRTPGTTTGVATRVSIRNALEKDIDNLCTAMNEGALLVLWSNGAKTPGVQIFRGPAIGKVLREIEFLQAIQDSVSLLSPEAIDSFNR
jgi:hypothetical protein